MAGLFPDKYREIRQNVMLKVKVKSVFFLVI